MPEGLEPAAVKANGCTEDCPFCAEAVMKNYKTKHGALKNETRLGSNLRSRKEITREKGVGPVFPLPGGRDRTLGWEAKPGVLETFGVRVKATPHHIIPGNASMEPSRLEQWTLEDKGKIKQDIGYNIDGPPNGIFLPHLPEIYFTAHAPGTDTPMATFFGKTFSGLSSSAKNSIGEAVMEEIELQMHYTDHDDPYVHSDPSQNYDDECKAECNLLSDRMQLLADNAKCPDASDNKLYPPYALVAMINGSSTLICQRITGSPRAWKSWVSPLAQNYTHTLKLRNAPKSRMRGTFRRLTR